MAFNDPVSNFGELRDECQRKQHHENPHKDVIERGEVPWIGKVLDAFAFTLERKQFLKNCFQFQE